MRSLLRWESFSAMADMFNRFPSLLGRWPRVSGNGDANLEGTPSVGINDAGREHPIRAALPAVKKGNVEVTVDDGMLTPGGERCQKEKHNDRTIHGVKCFYGASTRTFEFADAIDSAATSAESKNGEC